MPGFIVLFILRKYKNPRVIDPPAFAQRIRADIREGATLVGEDSIVLSTVQKFPTLKEANSAAKARVERWTSRNKEPCHVDEGEVTDGMLWILVLSPDATDVFEARVHKNPANDNEALGGLQ
ncbi:MAG: hypothetical protein L6R41_000210 [Letrouitia leprolyta]|nr:MAG: hypothetical protein L6R41_000210 [Letrouitia leprolyta]